MNSDESRRDIDERIAGRVPRFPRRSSNGCLVLLRLEPCGNKTSVSGGSYHRLWCIQGPRGQQSLVEKIFLAGIGCRFAVNYLACRRVDTMPILEVVLPFFRKLGERKETGSGILAHLGVMRGRGEHAKGSLLETELICLVECSNRFTKA